VCSYIYRRRLVGRSQVALASFQIKCTGIVPLCGRGVYDGTHKGELGIRMCLAPTSELNILQLVFIHAEIMPELVNDRAPDLIPDFGLGGAYRLNILLVEDDVNQGQSGD
jgi:hypothetical protein